MSKILSGKKELAVFKSTNALCYDTIKYRNLRVKYYVQKAETSFPKCRDFVLLKMMQCTKAEMFIHVPETFLHVRSSAEPYNEVNVH